jgi:hypothetical protein
MNNHLLERYKSVNDWLKFAETKHAAFIALNGGGIFGTLSSYPKVSGLCIYFKGAIILLFCTSMIFSIISFIPALRKAFLSKLYSNEDFLLNKHTINTLFYGDLAKLTTNQLLDLTKERDGVTEYRKVDVELADQIIQNSKIALTKYNYFNFSAWITFIAVVLGIANIFIFNGCPL